MSNISPQEKRRIWSLHGKGVKTSVIADIVGIDFYAVAMTVSEPRAEYEEARRTRSHQISPLRGAGDEYILHHYRKELKVASRRDGYYAFNRKFTKGKTAQQIAADLTSMLGVEITRNMVIGRAHRIGLGGDGSKSVPRRSNPDTGRPELVYPGGSLIR